MLPDRDGMRLALLTMLCNGPAEMVPAFDNSRWPKIQFAPLIIMAMDLFYRNEAGYER